MVTGHERNDHVTARKSQESRMKVTWPGDLKVAYAKAVHETSFQSHIYTLSSKGQVRASEIGSQK
jgi:hypothetical protein